MFKFILDWFKLRKQLINELNKAQETAEFWKLKAKQAEAKVYNQQKLIEDLTKQEVYSYE